MKKTVMVVAVTAVALLTVNSAWACAKCGCRTRTKTVVATADKHELKTVTTEELRGIVAKKDALLVDARSGKYDDGRRIGNARQLAAEASDKEIAEALPDKNARIVAYCTSTSCPASAKLAHRLEHLGYKNVAKYPDGIEGWVKAGNEVK